VVASDGPALDLDDWLRRYVALVLDQAGGVPVEKTAA